MDRLPKDVIGIVDRLLFDYNYDLVKQQYKQVFLCDAVWDNRYECFIHWVGNGQTGLFVANWRGLGLLHKRGAKDIKTFRSRFIVALLPLRYEWTYCPKTSLV